MDNPSTSSSTNNRPKRCNELHHADQPNTETRQGQETDYPRPMDHSERADDQRKSPTAPGESEVGANVLSGQQGSVLDTGSGNPLATESSVRQHLALMELGDSHYAQFHNLGNVADLDQAISYQQQAVFLTPDDHSDKPNRLRRLGISYMRRHKRHGQASDNNKAIESLLQAVLLAPDGSECKPDALDNLGMSYMRRFMRHGELTDISKAIEYQSQAVLQTPDGHAEKPSRLGNLGNSYTCRFERHGGLENVNKAIDCHKQAVLLTPDNHPSKPGRLNNLGIPYLRRFERFGNQEDVDKALEYQNQALIITPDDHVDKPIWLCNLGDSYMRRFAHYGELTDIDKAIEYLTQSVSQTPDGHLNKPIQLNNLGNSYLYRFEHHNELLDIDRAIDFHNQAVLQTADDHADKPIWLNNLGNSYLCRYELSGELEDIDMAIKCQSQAVSRLPDGHADKPDLLGSLGTSYGTRFKRHGEPADIDMAIKCHGQAILLTPDNHANKANYFNNLGGSYISRFDRHDEIADVDKAIEYQTKAVLLTPDDDMSKPGRLSNLGISYAVRFERTGEIADIEMAIEYQNHAVRLIPGDHARRPALLDSLGNSYLTRFERQGQRADIDMAIRYQDQAMALFPDTHARMPELLNNLGNSYTRRFEHYGELKDVESANKSFQRATLLPVTNPDIQFRCAWQWARSSPTLGMSPQQAYQKTMELVPHRIWLGTTVEQRYKLLTELENVAVEAAAWAISAQAYELAVEWLEEGRSIVWNQILQLRTPFDDLSLVDPVLAQRMKEVGVELEHASSRSVAISTSTDFVSDLEEDAQEHHRLATEWEQLLNQARLLPGLGDFMRPRKASDLICAAKDSAVVLINVHSSRCDALIILPNKKAIAHLPLDSLSPDKVIDARAKLLSWVGQRGAPSRGMVIKPSKRASKSEHFKAMLAMLWSDVVKPVLDFLEYTHNPQSDRRPLVTWCTTGPLSFLPLHAAGRYDGSQPNSFDIVVSSYTPTLGALLAPSLLVPGLSSGVLSVGQEHTKDLPSLPNTVQELEAIKQISKGAPYLQLDGDNATVDVVLNAMSEYTWVHLACHAVQHKGDPALSALHLSDGNLTLSKIAKKSFKNKGLAFLSACQTATGDEKLPDEAVHLAAGMLMAGYTNVIATMWSIQDEDAPVVARNVYAELLKDGKMDCTKAARALHDAVGHLRSKVGEMAFERWVPFVHIGVSEQGAGNGVSLGDVS